VTSVVPAVHRRLRFTSCVVESCPHITSAAMRNLSASTRRSVLICLFYACTSVTLSFVNKVCVERSRLAHTVHSCTIACAHMPAAPAVCTEPVPVQVPFLLASHTVGVFAGHMHRGQGTRRQWRRA